MKLSIFSCLFRALLLAIPFFATAQKRTFLAPQRHKLLWADTVYNEAIAKKDTPMLAEAYYLYGKTYDAAGDAATSQRWFFKSLRLLEPRGDSPELCRLYSRFASAELDQLNYMAALNYTRKSMAMARRIKVYKYLNRAYANMASIHNYDWSLGGKKPEMPKQRLDSAMYYYLKIEALSLKIKDSLQLASINTAIGTFSWIYFKDARAFELRFNRALSIYTKLKEDGQILEVLFDFSGYYLETRRYQAAWMALERARKIYESHPYGDVRNKIMFADLYSRYFQQTGNWKKAFEYREKSRQLNMENYAADRNLAYSRLAKEYETEKKDALLKAKDTELALKSDVLLAHQRFTLTAIILLLLLAVTSVVFYRLFKKNQKISAQNALLVKEQNHRVKNNLQAISSLLNLQSNALTDPEAVRAIEQSRSRVETMAVLHRKLYDGPHLAKVYLPDLLEEIAESVLQNYGCESVKTEIQIAPIYLSADHAISMGLILNELVTNACKYAFPNHDSPELTIICRRLHTGNKNRIELVVKDNGYRSEANELDYLIDNTRRNKAITGDSAVNLTQRASARTGSAFGMQLIRMGTEQLYADYKFTYSHGTLFTMDFKEE